MSGYTTVALSSKHGIVAFCIIYYKNTNEIAVELSLENLISSCVKITCYLHV